VIRAAVLAALLLTSGCAQYGAVTSAIRINGAETADNQLDLALYSACYPVTVGAWVRKYGRDPERAQAWQVLCFGAESLTMPIGKK
jgi:hypothetical protein